MISYLLKKSLSCRHNPSLVDVANSAIQPAFPCLFTGQLSALIVPRLRPGHHLSNAQRESVTVDGRRTCTGWWWCCVRFSAVGWFPCVCLSVLFSSLSLLPSCSLSNTTLSLPVIQFATESIHSKLAEARQKFRGTIKQHLDSMATHSR